MSPKGSRKEFVQVYIGAELRARLDVVHGELRRRAIGTRIALSEVSRRVIELGVGVMEAELDIEEEES